MAMTQNIEQKRYSYQVTSVEDLVPEDHFVRKIEKAMDFNFIYDIVKDLYSHKGRPSIDPVVLFKMAFINYIFGIHSMRRTCNEIEVNIAYRWFLGLELTEKVPNYSTFSQNYRRKFRETEVFNKIFSHILDQASQYGFIDPTTLFGDSTHIKASANKNKYTKEIIEVQAKEYQEQLLAEINQDRKQHNKKPLKKKKN